MPETNKHNLVYFEDSTMCGLYTSMEEGQQINNRRLLSISIQSEDGRYCCVALTNPTKVVITSKDGKKRVGVADLGQLITC
jgi:hypothetical protein